MNLLVLWLRGGSPAFVASIEEQLRPDGYTLLHPDPLLPTGQLPAARFALIEWVGEGKATGQVQLLRQHQPACFPLLLVPKEHSVVLEAVLLTATGYLAAPLCPTELLTCLNSIRIGNGYWNADLLALLTGTLLTQRTYPAGLNRREHDLWDHLANGLTNPQIEAIMCLSNSRVKNLKTGLAQKLGLSNAHHLTAWAVEWRKAHL